MRSYSKENKAVGHYDDLSDAIKTLISEMCLETFKQNTECYTDPDNSVEDIECHSRDGFIAYDHNRGGIMIRGFSTLMDVWGSGDFCAHKGAAKEIQRQIDYSFKCLEDSVFEEFKEELEKRGMTKADCNYHAIDKLRNANPDDDFYSDVGRYIENGEFEVLGGSENSIMYEVRLMYHGKVDGIHSASVSCAVNTEGPYHRSSIAWAPGVFCEGAKEVEFSWLTVKELETKLSKALTETSKAIF